MRRYLLRRGLFALLLIFVVSSGALILTLLAPGDFTTQESFETDEPTRARLRAELGLDKPVLTQYFSWLRQALRLYFGYSMLYSRPVADLLAERAGNTAILALVALVIATGVGIPLGVVTGTRPKSVIARVVRGVSLLLLSIPPLLSSLLLLLVAARTGWLPTGGMSSAAVADAAWGIWLRDLAHHVPLPALALTLPMAATLERLQSQALMDASREPFVQAARARGLSLDGVMWRHAWRASLAPVLGLYGLMIGSLFSGSFVVEVVTAWPGLGRLMYDALRARDLHLVAGCAAAGALFLAIGTFIADVLLVIADPRRRGADA